MEIRPRLVAIDRKGAAGAANAGEAGVKRITNTYLGNTGCRKFLVKVSRSLVIS